MGPVIVTPRMQMNCQSLTQSQNQNLSLSPIQDRGHQGRLIGPWHNHHHRNQIQMIALRNCAKNFYLMPTRQANPPMRHLDRAFQSKEKWAQRILTFLMISCGIPGRSFIPDQELKQKTEHLVLRGLPKTQSPYPLPAHRVMQLWAIDSILETVA